MFRKLISASLVAATLAGATLATTGTAEAGWGRGGCLRRRRHRRPAARRHRRQLLLQQLPSGLHYYAPACFGAASAYMTLLRLLLGSRAHLPLSPHRTSLGTRRARTRSRCPEEAPPPRRGFTT